MTARNNKRGGTAMRDRLVVFPFTAVLLLLLFAGSTYAHHGFVSWFDVNHLTTVKGAVTSFDWTNPHAYIYLDVKDEKGNIEKWTAELGALGMLGRTGWRRDTLKPGDEITAIGNPAKDGKPVMHLTKIVFANGQELSSAL
jgi:hypothetical protein